MATLVAVLLHTPPGAASVNDVVVSAQSVNVPVIVPGSGLTVTGCVAEQPATVKLTIEGLPALIPVNVPVEVLMVA